MSILCLSSNAVSVRLVSERLVVERRDFANREAPSEFQTLHLYDLERVECVGRPNITFPVICELADRGIPCVMLTRGGKWRGNLLPASDGDGARRIRQYRCAADEDFNVQVARLLVSAKIRNMRVVLEKISSNRGQKKSTMIAEDTLRCMGSGLRGAKTVAEIRGCEGRASANYFKALSAFFPDGFPFVNRSRRPPRDAANALLSFAYAIVLGEVVATVRKHGLDSGIGVLHVCRNGRPSLALDLMEPFRPALADRLVLGLLNGGTMVVEDFDSLQHKKHF